MKSYFLKFNFCLLLLISFLSCEHEEVTVDNSQDTEEKTNSKTYENIDGNYSGVFSVVYNNDSTYSDSVTVYFNDSLNYDCSSKPNRIPAGGNGTYTQNDSTVTFSDINYWTADFDWNLILKGEYNYHLSSDSLIFSAHKNNVGFYKYELLKN